MPAPAIVTLLTRPGCHLCDDARVVVTAVVAQNPHAILVERSIEDDPVLVEQYAEEIPVVLINDRVHNIWRVDAERLLSALNKETS